MQCCQGFTDDFAARNLPAGSAIRSEANDSGRKTAVVVEICFFLPFLLSPKKKGYLRQSCKPFFDGNREFSRK